MGTAILFQMHQEQSTGQAGIRRIRALAFGSSTPKNGVKTRRLCTNGTEQMYINVSSEADSIYAAAFAVNDMDFAVHFQVPNP